MPRPVTKFRNKCTETVFRHIVEDDRLLDEVTEDLSSVGSIDDATSILKNTVRLRFHWPPVEFNGVEWERLAKSLIPST